MVELAEKSLCSPGVEQKRQLGGALVCMKTQNPWMEPLRADVFCWYSSGGGGCQRQRLPPAWWAVAMQRAGPGRSGPERAETTPPLPGLFSICFLATKQKGLPGGPERR